ncbi:MAG: 16S rRNA (guanine(527)-N(7))-methyltransferase RsmG [Lachnospiraceae bacterium]|jgi:16S rRNA (guanine527-N7)-methyltransferase|nr:16S rRNA (guanine(527)-N(7))-methyltransferase RsmG [Lachnospiraceae bacterium]
MEKLREYAKEIGIDLSDEQLDKFFTYYEMLIETNKVMNLTAITDKDEVIVKHFLDSMLLVKAYPDILDCEKVKILDLGTGAGFPGLPLKIVFPYIDIVLMDSLNKRVKFLQEVIDKLGLNGIEAIHGRAEEMARNKTHREAYDICVSRAVANLSTLSEYCLPFVKVSGSFISYKSSEIEEELNSAKKAITTIGGKLTAVKKVNLPGSDIERSFVIIAKEKNTPKAYPRKAGTATKNPL